MRSAIAAAYRDLKDTKAARTSFHMPGLQGRTENKSHQLQYRQEKLTLPEKKQKKKLYQKINYMEVLNQQTKQD